MSERNAEGPADPASLVTFFNTPRGLLVAALALAVLMGGLFFANLSKVGLWEPWEAQEILVAQEYNERDPYVFDETDLARPGYNWAVPTLEEKPVARPLLKTWLVAASLKVVGHGDEPQVGPLEFWTRFPGAFAAFLLVLLGFFWMRRHYGTWQALVASVVVATTPAIFLGAKFLTAEMLFVATTSAAIMAFAQLLYAREQKHKMLWGGLFGLAMALAILDQRLLGLFVPLFVIVGFALTQLPFLEAQRRREGDKGPGLVGPVELGFAAAGLVAIAGAVIWGLGRSADYDEGIFLPHVAQLISFFIPVFLLLFGVLVARKTDAIQSLKGVPGALAAIVAGVPLVAMAVAYGEVNPTLLMDGEVTGKIPVLTYLLENHLFEKSLASEHKHFALWMRQVGFATLPWVTLVPLALGYLARSTRLEDDEGAPVEGILEPSVAIHRLLLVWIFVGFLVIAAAAIHGHFFYPAYFPLLAGVGLMISDGKFWSWMRTRPLVMHAMGMTAVMVIMMLGKDLERFPARLIELYVTLEKDFELPESFEYGRLLKMLKYATMLLLAIYFGGLVSWGMLFLRDLKAFPGKAKQWWKTRKEPRPTAASTDVATNPSKERAEAKEAFRQGGGFFALIARWAERPAGFCVYIGAAFIVFAAAINFVFVPDLTHHLSQRGVFETYLAASEDGEGLYRYQLSDAKASVYLDGTEAMSASPQFLEAFNKEERFFAVIPRDRLAAVNYEVRNRHKRNLAVLDARSSRLLLVSNQLKDGEEDQNFVAAAIVEDESEIQHRVTFNHDGEDKHAVFDNSLELIGYSLDRPAGRDGLPTYKWGEEMTLTTYYRVLRRVTTQQRIFLHVDFPGNRLHGDHDPVGGEFPTNYWLAGDIVKDEYNLTIDRYSSVGTYTINTGLFRGSNRMKVEPRPAHDGQNRVSLGRIRVEAF